MNRGFTLWETILALMVVALAFVGIAPMIAASSQSYLVSRSVQPALDQARLALERMRREIRKGDCAQTPALLFPLTGTTLSFQPATGTATYRLATGVQSLTLGLRQGLNSCLVTISLTVAAPLPWDNQTTVIPFRTAVMVNR